jgi:hypothetical protein
MKSQTHHYQLHIPFFEFLRLKTWLTASDPYPIAGIGDIGVYNGIMTVNRFFLINQNNKDTKKQLAVVCKELLKISQKTEKIPLWFFRDTCLYVPSGKFKILQTYKSLKSDSINCSVGVIIGHDGIFNAVFTLYNPIVLYKNLEPIIMLPTVDDSALNHWLVEYKKNISERQERIQSSHTLNPSQSYACNPCEIRHFFKQN